MNPLPLIDNVLFIDNSSWMEGIQTCPRFVEYRQLYRRSPAAEAPALNFGSAIHLALEHRYKNYLSQPVDEAYYNSLAPLFEEFFNLHPPLQEDYRNMNWAMEVVKRYNTRYVTEPFNLYLDKDGKPVVELAFSVPLFTYKHIKVVYTGRIDLPVELDGQIFIMDHKTTSILGPTFFDNMRRAAQMRGYCWAFEQLTGNKPTGYYVNAIRVKEPPQYVMNGTPSRYGGKQQTPDQWWEESLQRERYYLADHELDEWKQNTICHIEEFMWHYERGYLPQRTTWCVSKYGKCPYFDVCTLEPKDRGAYLASGLFMDNNWSPLKDVTQSKQ